MMDKTEYLIQLKSIFNAAKLIRPLKIQDVLDEMNHAETIGPILDPTLYLKSAKGLEWQKRTVEAALKFQLTIEQIASDPRYA